jgi:hypothetical protein
MSPVAALAPAIDELIQALHVCRQLPEPDTRDTDAVYELHRKVTRLSLAAGLGEPPAFSGAGLVCFNPLIYPPQRYPCREAGRDYERQLRRHFQDWARAEEAQAHGAVAADAAQPPAPPPQTPSIEQTSPVARAIVLLLESDRCGQQITVDQIIAIVGCSRATLYRDPQFRATRKALKEKRQGTPPPRGHKDASGKLEAEEEE